MGKFRKDYKPLNFFINPINSYPGQAIVQSIRNDDIPGIQHHSIYGTNNPRYQATLPEGAKGVIDNTDVQALTKSILDSDVIVYDLANSPLNEIEYAIKTLRVTEYQGDKIFILISSVLVWSDTPPKEKAEEEEEDEVVEDSDEEPKPDDDVQPDDDADGDEPKKIYVSYKEADFFRRKPSTKYEIFKSIETLCLSAGNSKKNLLTYVLCSGILYGNGEHALHSYFKRAWLQSPTHLPVYGDGQNLIPTIHVRDLAMYVNLIFEKKPETRYIYATDFTKKPTQKKLILTISKGLGTGKIENVDKDFAKLEPIGDIMTLDIKLKPSNIVELIQQKEEEAGENQDDDADEDADLDPDDPETEKIKLMRQNEPKVPKFEFKWWCKDGLKANIAKIVDEFNAFNKLKPIRIFITGPPASGKTYFSDLVCKHFNIPHILVKDVFQAYSNLPEGDEFGDEIRAALDERREEEMQKKREEWEAEQEKRKKRNPEAEDEEFNEENVKLDVRLKEALLAKCYKKRLAANDCFNRGFVLDGFPRTYEDAKEVFLMVAPKPEGDDDAGDDDEEKKVLDPKQSPEFVIYLHAPDDFLINRVKGLDEATIAGTHFTQEDMERRLKKYHKDNTSEDGSPVLESFFKENSINVLHINVNTSTVEDIVKAIKIFVEKTFEEAQEHDRKVKVELDKLAKQEDRMEEMKVEDDHENEYRRVQEAKAKLKLEALKEEEKKLLDIRSQPLRDYLGNNVVPILTDGIAEICKKRPEDPVDFLAEYLFRRSLEVKNTDPRKKD